MNTTNSLHQEAVIGLPATQTNCDAVPTSDRSDSNSGTETNASPPEADEAPISPPPSGQEGERQQAPPVGVEAGLAFLNANKADPPLNPEKTSEGPPVESGGGLPAPAAAMPLAEILDSISGFLTRFVVFANPNHPCLISLWIAHTWVYDAFEFTPYLHIFSPEKRCGKSRLLECIGLLCRNAWPVVIPTAPVLFRKIERDAPTILFDEIDTVFSSKSDGSKEALRGVLNVGFATHGVIPRCGGPDQELKDYGVFCPKALAGIGKIPDTISDRCIPVRLERRSRHDDVAGFRAREVRPKVKPLVEALSTWRDDPLTFGALEKARPKMPQELVDRQADIAEPLLAIAELASEKWADQARAVLVSSCVDLSAGEESIGVQLLTDLQRVFTGDKMPTVKILRHLVDLDTDAPWATMWEESLDQGKTGAPAGKLARILDQYGIGPTTYRLPRAKPVKGYLRSSFLDAWARYCQPIVSEAVTQ